MRLRVVRKRKASPSQAGSNPPSPHSSQGHLDLLLVPQAYGQEVTVGAVRDWTFVEDSLVDLLGHEAELLQVLPKLLSRALGQIPVDTGFLGLDQDDERRLVRSQVQRAGTR